MGRLISKKTVERKNEFDSRQRKSNLRNICGTFAAEGMTISKYTRRNLGRIASGQTSYQQVLAELRAKYEKRGYRGMEIPADAYAQKRMLRSLMNIRRPQAIDAEFLTVQDEYLRQEIKDAGITRLADLEPVCGDFYLWQGDITRLQCGAIVNAANSGMTGCYVPCHACIDNCIHTFAGVQLRLDCAELMERQGHEEPTGQAKITKAYNLPCDYVLHTVGPIVDGRVTPEDERLLASCYRSCLELAGQNGVESIAFCCISTGVFHFPNQRAAEIAVETVQKFKTETGSEMEVIFNVSKTWILKSIGDYSQKIDRLKAELQDADTILIGAGSGLSTSAGLTYDGERFLKHFSDFHEKYGITDMYSGGFYPFSSPEEYWAWWSRHIYYNRYDVTPGKPYADLLELVMDKNYFVLTTNVDHQFQLAGFNKARLFYTQGDYGLWQCSEPVPSGHL